MKVLLINPHLAAGDSAGYYGRFLEPMPPITLAYLAAALEQAGVAVRVYDDALEGGDPVRLEEVVRTARPDVVGLSAVTATVPAVERVVRRVRALDAGIRVVLGGIHADVYAGPILRAGLADAVVHGEGERTLVELVAAWSRGPGALGDVAGISFADGADVVRTAPRPLVEDLDALPFPAWHLFPHERYRLFGFARVREPGTLILGSRGCPYGCTYCSLRIMGRRRRARSAASLADEFEHLLERFGVRQPSFTDPIFPFDRGEGLAFAAELIRRGLHREQVWITETRADRVDAELLGALRESGLRRVMFGFECDAAEQLDAVRKGVGADEGFAAVRAARAAGLQVIGFFMLGMPGSTPATLRATIDYARALDVDFAKFTVFVPFPGTEVHGELLARGAIDEPERWERYTSYPTRATPPCYVPEGLTAADLVAAQRRAYASFYLRPRMAARHLLRLRALTPRDALAGVGALARASLSRG